MKRNLTVLAMSLGAALILSCGGVRAAQSANPRADDSARRGALSGVRFEDHTREIVGEALKLIAKNQREGAPLNQRWYALRHFQENVQLIFKAREIRFYGGREIDVRSAIARQYAALTPFESAQSSGEIRLFTARRDGDGFDLVIIGQNGREVALKTAIRLIYLFKFTNAKIKGARAGGLPTFVQRMKVFLSSITPKQEFMDFFERYGIDNPEAVLIGFQGDTRAVLKQAGIENPKRYSNDSLRVNWFPKADGKKVLLVSINGNRIYASRAGDLIKAIFETFHPAPRALVFFGSGGAIANANLVGRIVAPTVVVQDDFFIPPTRR